MPSYKFLLFLFCLPMVSILAQTKFEKGYLIDNKSDSIPCLIENRKWLESPKQITYKLIEDGNTFLADATTIKEFQVGKDLYKSLTAEFPAYKDKVDQENPNKEIKTVNRTVFIKRLLRGTAYLYQYRLGNERSFIYSLEVGPLTVLLYSEYLTADNRIRSNNAFRNQLFKEINCGTESGIQEVKYTRRSLEEYFNKFNTCSNPEMSFSTEEIDIEDKGDLSIKIWAGVQHYDFKIAFSGGELDYTKNAVPKIGLELENIFPYNNRKWAVFFSTQYTSHSSDGYGDNGQGMNVVRGTLELSRLESLVAGRHYMFLNDHSSLFIEAGAAFDIDFKSDITGVGLPFNETEGKRTNFAIATGLGYSHNQKLYVRLNYYFDQNILLFLGGTYKNALSRTALAIGYKI